MPASRRLRASIAARLRRAVTRSRQMASVMPRAEYVAFLERDSKTWGDVVAKGNIKIDEN